MQEGTVLSPLESTSARCKTSDNSGEDESTFPVMDGDNKSDSLDRISNGGNDAFSVSDSREASVQLPEQSLENDEMKSKTFTANVKVDFPLLRFVKGRGDKIKESIEKQTDTKLLIPLPHAVKAGCCIVVEGLLEESVEAAVRQIHSVVDEAIRSSRLDYSHFISLPLAVHSVLVDQVAEFQSSILASINTEKQATDEELDVESLNIVNEGEDPEETVDDSLGTDKVLDTVGNANETAATKKNRRGIDASIMVKPKTIHITVLMLKLWNQDRITAAAETLQRSMAKVHEALEGRPVAVRLKGLECMRGSPAKAHVLYAHVGEVDQDNRLTKACQAIIDEFVAAGLVLDADKSQKLKLHVTLINTRQRKQKRRKNFQKRIPFDARQILSQHGSLDFGEHPITEAHLSERFQYGENGYYNCLGSIGFPTVMS
eukprot:c27527_g1_i3 orf=238-1527(+)